ncbi:unnamed protein product [Rhizoctonia solani]|uniref:Uncharacterized protein n=1 Tax=Rhizoctonia solani TaxID=456999 RepID=A0A8H2WJ41_9AGAM|nr:unnamed protein product [Rhizoctonia solani]
MAYLEIQPFKLKLDALGSLTPMTSRERGSRLAPIPQRTASRRPLRKYLDLIFGLTRPTTLMARHPASNSRLFQHRLFTPAVADQFLQFPPNSPKSHPLSFGEIPMPALYQRNLIRLLCRAPYHARCHHLNAHENARLMRGTLEKCSECIKLGLNDGRTSSGLISYRSARVGPSLALLYGTLLVTPNTNENAAMDQLFDRFKTLHTTGSTPSPRQVTAGPRLTPLLVGAQATTRATTRLRATSLATEAVAVERALPAPPTRTRSPATAHASSTAPTGVPSPAEWSNAPATSAEAAMPCVLFTLSKVSSNLPRATDYCACIIYGHLHRLLTASKPEPNDQPRTRPLDYTPFLDALLTSTTMTRQPSIRPCP